MSIRPLCYVAFGCGACGVEINPWMPRNFQRHAQTDPLVDAVPGMSWRDVEGLCDDFAPADEYATPGTVVLDSDGEPCGFAAPWFNDALPDISGGAFGFIFRGGDSQFKIESPRELTASDRSKARAKGCLIRDGRRLGSFSVETVATSRQSALYLADWLTNGLTGGSRCCGQSVEIWVHCCDLDGKSGRRLLTDVADINVECVDVEPATKCGIVLDVVFSAGDLIIEADDKLTGEPESHGTVCVPICPPTVEVVERDVLAPKPTCNVDIYRRPDGSLRHCFVDCDDYRPDTHEAVVRQVLADEVTAEDCCPVAIERIDLTGDDPVVVPAQPTLWQSQILDPILLGEGIDCNCQPVIRNLRLVNKTFDETAICPTCPEGIRAEACLKNSPLTLDGDRLLDLAAAGIVDNTEVWWTQTGGATVFDGLLDYLICMGVMGDSSLFGPTIPSTLAGDIQTIIDLCVANNSFGAGFVPTGAMLSIVTVGSQRWFRVSPQVSAGSGPPGPECIVTVMDFPGLNTPVQSPEQAAACEPDINPNCLPYLDVQPSGSDVCVTITVAADGSAALTYPNGQPVNPEIDDLSGARFEFAPCSPQTSEECPPIIPPVAELSIDTATGDAAALNFTVGAGWPYDTAASQYVVTSTDLGANNDDPILATERVRQPVDRGLLCEPECGVVPKRFPVAPDSCWPECLDEERQLVTVEIDGLDPATCYIPSFKITAAGDDIRYLEAFVAPMPSPFMSPEDSLAGYICGDTPIPPVQIPRLASMQTVKLDEDRVTIDCAGRFVDAKANGFAAAGTRPFGRPRISGVDRAVLVVLFPCETEEPTVEFCVEAVAVA